MTSTDCCLRPLSLIQTAQETLQLCKRLRHLRLNFSTEAESFVNGDWLLADVLGPRSDKLESLFIVPEIVYRSEEAFCMELKSIFEGGALKVCNE